MSQHLLVVNNRPGLSALAYRIATYAEWRRHLVDELASSDHPALAGLTTRDPSDFTLALLDAWSCALDVVTFYQERTADESYLRTARDFTSVRELARQIGYVPGPGLAAGALLSIALDRSPGAPERVQTAPGLSVMSVPAPGESAMTFETVEPLALRPTYNALPALRTSPVHTFTGELVLAGTDTGLDPGDFLVLVEEPGNGALFGSQDAKVVRLDRVAVDAGAGVTRVAWSGFGFHPRSGRVLAFTPRRQVPAPDENPPLPPVTLLAGGPLLRLSADRTQRFPFAGFDRATTPVFIVTDGALFDIYPPHPVTPNDQVNPNAGRTPLDRFRPGSIRIHYNFRQLAVAAVPQPLTVRDELHLAAPPALNPGDGLLVTDGRGERWAFASVGSVRRDIARNAFVVAPQWTAGSTARLVPGDDLRVHALRQRSPLFGHNAPDPFQVPLTYTRSDLERTFSDTTLTVRIPGVAEPVTVRQITNARWRDFPQAPLGRIDLAQSFPQLQPGAVVVLADGGRVSRFVAADVSSVRLQDYTLDALCTRVRVDEALPRPTHEFVLTSTIAHFGAELLPLTDTPLPPELDGDEILVEGDVADLPPGRTLIVTGQDLAGAASSEVVRLVDASRERAHTRLRVAPALARAYRRATVSVLANVVRATHGETVSEVLGNGDATAAFQRFPLAQGPLTFVSAANAEGRRSTLEVRVGGLLWREVDRLTDAGPSDRVYTLVVAHTGRTYVQFGDGVRGARLPTGVANVRAVYRHGTGLAGQVRKDTLTLPLRAPAGIQAVTNPLPATGAADPERLQDARRNATRTVIALDRVVSLRDYEDFARAFSGVAKAQATRRGPTGVALTVAGPGGAPIVRGTDLFTNLLAAVRAAGDPGVSLTLHGFTEVRFALGGTVRRAPDVLADDLARALRAALLARFSFDARDFAEPVYLSAVIAAIQSVPGVVAVDVDRLARAGDPSQPERPPARLVAGQLGQPGVAATELLVLDPDSLSALVVSP